MRIEKLMTHQVSTCRPQDSLEHAACLMWDNDCGRLPVVDKDGALIGIVSMADIVRESARLQYGQRQQIPASEVMTTLAGICTPAPEKSAA